MRNVALRRRPQLLHERQLLVSLLRESNPEQAGDLVLRHLEDLAQRLVGDVRRVPGLLDDPPELELEHVVDLLLADFLHKFVILFDCNCGNSRAAKLRKGLEIEWAGIVLFLNNM